MSTSLNRTRHVFACFTASLVCCWLLSARAAAQGPPADRTFHASKAEVQKALLNIQSYPGGKLPILEGFADAETIPSISISAATMSTCCVFGRPVRPRPWCTWT